MVPALVESGEFPLGAWGGAYKAKAQTVQVRQAAAHLYQEIQQQTVRSSLDFYGNSLGKISSLLMRCRLRRTALQYGTC